MTPVEIKCVGAGEDGMRLDRWFRAHYPALAHGALQKLLRTGQIRVDGGRAKANARLAAGQKVRVPPMEAGAAKPEKNVQLSPQDARFIQSLVIHKDKDIIALNKPPGLAVQGGARTHRHIDALLDGLRYDADERPRLVHRLDKDTSGVLLLARNRVAASALGDALKSRSAIKTYWSLLIGVPSPERGEISVPLVKKGGARSEKMHAAGEGDSQAKRAMTRYSVIETAGGKLCWAALWPQTGRTHQLRAHMAAIGHPVVGDGKYGGRSAHPGGAIEGKMHLHARAIEVPHPAGGSLKVTAPLPDHMRKSWKLLGFDPDLETDPAGNGVAG
jgi:23S rRNA pseudouridine955/2504/2580 synthase